MNDLTIANARAADLLTLAGRYSKLRRASSTELEGPCPRCGGTDRLHVKADAWFCRQCHPKFGDAIEFIRWVEGKTFPEAVEMLTGQQLTRTPQQQPTPKRTQPEAPTWDIRSVGVKLQEMQAYLEDSPGADYLNSRNLWPDTWAAFGLGYDAQRNAIAIPWFRAKQLWGIRYRLIAPTTAQKMVSEPGSRFGSLLFGGQAFPDLDAATRAHRYLLIIEGEINAMSAWQTMQNGRMDVLSLGSESAHIPDAFLPVAAQYRTRIVWMDKEARAKEEAARIDAAALWSENEGRKLDANDHLRAGNLYGILAHVLERQTPQQHHEALQYDMWDAANLPT